jgi:hypothetical protein
MKFTTLAAVALSLLLVRPDDDLKTIKLNDMDCGPEGTATSEAGKALNSLKNRYKAPTEEEIDPEVSLPAMLAPGYDRTRFDSKKAATIHGYVVRVMMGGRAETCNCGATKPDERDTHIEIALHKDAPEIQRVIVEVTPRGRKVNGAKWSTKALKKAFEGKWVEVTGWLMFDEIHRNQAENTNPGGKRNWRATCWEIHPISAIKVVKEPPKPLAAFQPTSFRAMQRTHAAHVTATARARDAIQKRNDVALSKFDKKELEEAENESKDRHSDKEP